MYTHIMFTSRFTKTFHVLYCTLWVLIFFVGEYTINLKRGQVKIRTNGRQSLCLYIHRIVWDLSFSVVIVCILWMAFFSRELD